MNLLDIKLRYSEVIKKITISWQDLKYAVENKFLFPESAIEHASNLINEETNENSPLVELVTFNEQSNILHQIEKLAKLENQISENIIREKWLFIILEHLYEHKNQYNDPLDLIELIYSDFDYPEIISNIIRYMPMEGPDLGSVELNEARLYKNWEKYLCGQRKRFSL